MGRMLRALALFAVLAALMIGLFVMALSSLGHDEAQEYQDLKRAMEQRN